MAEADPKGKVDFYSKINEYNFGECKYSLLIVGPTGAGKSAFCNFLLKEKRFKETLGMLAGTGKADHCIISSNMLIADCPGFCDPKSSHDDIMDEICKAAILCRNGMDAIGIVIDPTVRFTDTQKNACEQMELFGGNFWKHAFIIFNREKDILEDQEFSDASKYIEKIKDDPECPPVLTTFLENVKSRFIFVESKRRPDDPVYHQKVLDSVLAMILQIKENTKIPYSNCFMEFAQKKIKYLSASNKEVTAKIALLESQAKVRDNIIEEIESMKENFREEMKKYHSEMTDLLLASLVMTAEADKKATAEADKKEKGWGCLIM